MWVGVVQKQYEWFYLVLKDNDLEVDFDFICKLLDEL